MVYLLPFEYNFCDLTDIIASIFVNALAQKINRLVYALIETKTSAP